MKYPTLHDLPKRAAALVLTAALLIPSVIWTVIARSATPMRHKIGMIFSLLLLVVAIANSGVLVLL